MVTNQKQHKKEIEARTRFEFGANWKRFLALLNDHRIQIAEESLKDKLQVEDLKGKSFLDIGSGSGLFSLAAMRLGARVFSFDYDPQSVECTRELKSRYFPDDDNWSIEHGSVLDIEYLGGLEAFDIVYSWGVLHHTGEMWQSLENVASLVAPEGRLFIAIYNDQGFPSKMWLLVKKLYNKMPKWLRWLVLYPTTIRLWGPTCMKDLLRGKPFYTWSNYHKESVRGMSAWTDVVDWVGGIPFEVAKPEEIFSFFFAKNFILTRLKTCRAGKGCNEFVFSKSHLL